jgi:hypothetical protein
LFHQMLLVDMEVLVTDYWVDSSSSPDQNSVEMSARAVVDSPETYQKSRST